MFYFVRSLRLTNICENKYILIFKIQWNKKNNINSNQKQISLLLQLFSCYSGGRNLCSASDFLI
jgi:hypothetical protein